MRGPFNAWDGLTGRIIIIVALHIYNSIRIDMWEWRSEWTSSSIETSNEEDGMRTGCASVVVGMFVLRVCILITAYLTRNKKMYEREIIIIHTKLRSALII